MLIVEYRNDNSGFAFGDFEAMPKAKIIVENLKKANRLGIGAEDYVYCVSSQNIVEAFRVLVVNKEIEHKDIMFSFEGKKITINKHGQLSEWHKGFCDTIDKFLTEILSKGIMKMNK